MRQDYLQAYVKKDEAIPTYEAQSSVAKNNQSTRVKKSIYKLLVWIEIIQIFN